VEREQQLQQLRLLSQTRQRSDDGEVVIKAHRPLGQMLSKQQQYEREPPRWVAAGGLGSCCSQDTQRCQRCQRCSRCQVKLWQRGCPVRGTVQAPEQHTCLGPPQRTAQLLPAAAWPLAHGAAGARERVLHRGAVRRLHPAPQGRAARPGVLGGAQAAVQHRHVPRRAAAGQQDSTGAVPAAAGRQRAGAGGGADGGRRNTGPSAAGAAGGLLGRWQGPPGPGAWLGSSSTQPPCERQRPPGGGSRGCALSAPPPSPAGRRSGVWHAASERPHAALRALNRQQRLAGVPAAQRSQRRQLQPLPTPRGRHTVRAAPGGAQRGRRQRGAAAQRGLPLPPAAASAAGG
jgi:hypothetical protein